MCEVILIAQLNHSVRQLTTLLSQSTRQQRLSHLSRSIVEDLVSGETETLKTGRWNSLTEYKQAHTFICKKSCCGSGTQRLMTIQIASGFVIPLMEHLLESTGLLGYLLASSITSRSLANSALVRWYCSGSLSAVSRMSNTTALMSLRERRTYGQMKATIWAGVSGTVRMRKGQIRCWRYSHN